MRLDPRVHAVRRDIADIALADRVVSPHYARALDYGCSAITVAIRVAPSLADVASSELLLGETFAVLDAAGDWAWGFCRHDGYVGYVPLDALDPIVQPTHVVSSAAALLFASADIKSPVVARLPMGARITAKEAGDFLETSGGLVHCRHASRLDAIASDPVAVAERLIGTPYRWGGRSGDGIDCSGLVQLAHAFCGIQLPRDSDQQRDAFGTPLAPGELPRRGDLLFLPGHVALVADEHSVVHANAHWMATAREPIVDVLARQADAAGAALVRRQ